MTPTEWSLLFLSILAVWFSARAVHLSYQILTLVTEDRHRSRGGGMAIIASDDFLNHLQSLVDEDEPEQSNFEAWDGGAV